MTQLGFLRRHAKGGYSIGSAVLGPAYVFYSGLDVRQLVRPHLHRIATRPGVLYSLGARSDLTIVGLETVAGNWTAPMIEPFKAHAPLALSAAGHAYLAGIDEANRTDLLSAMKLSNPSKWSAIRDQIERDIASVKDAGYCIVIREWQSLVSGVAAPLRISDDLVLTLSAGGPSKVLDPEDLHAIGAELVTIAREISETA